MSLFTFSSNNNLLKLAGLTIIVFSFYSLALQKANPSVTVFQNQFIRNYSIAEKYIYADHSPKIIIVGSSLSSRLIRDQFNNDIYNLSFTAGSVLTALNIIKESKRIPDTIFIESNVAHKELDNEMIKNLFTPIIWQLRGHIKSLQFTYQPINIILSAANSLYNKNKTEHSNEVPNKKLLQTSLSKFVKENNSPIGPAGKNNLTELKSVVNYFKSKGTHIVFFEMPVHPLLLSSRKYSELRSNLQAMFPDSVFYWVDRSDAEKYLTNDGIHLLHKSAYDYSVLLSGLIEKEVKALH